MKNMYGYREEDVIGLAELLKIRKNKPLSAVFEEYGIKSGKAKGTVRNLYYALAKISVSDKDFCEKYLDGTPLSVGKIVEFNKCEERTLIKKILIAKSEGCSVRSAIMELARGDAKTALRFQNKYINAVKNNPEIIKEIINELHKKGKDVEKAVENRKGEVISDGQFEKIKNEINGLVGRIALKTQKENEFLKARISALERENIKLYNILYGKASPDTLKYFRRGGERGIIN